MSVFAEALAQARAGVVNYPPLDDSRPYQTEHYRQVRDEALAALDLIEQRATDMEAALRNGQRLAYRYMDTGRGDLDGWAASVEWLLSRAAPSAREEAS